MKTDKQIYCEHLMLAAIKSDIDVNELSPLFKTFNERADESNPHSAFKELFKRHIKNQSFVTATASVQSELERLVKGKMIDTNPISRMVEKNVRKNFLISKLELEGVSDEDNKRLRAQAQTTLPEVFTKQYEASVRRYSATANYKSSPVKMEIEYTV